MMLSRRIAFYETDMMGVVHHSNYLRYFEDARLEWLAQSGMLQNYSQSTDLQFAVVEANVVYKKPCSYGDIIEIHIKVQKNKAKLRFDYEIYNSHQELICTGHTTHVTVDRNLKICRIPSEIEKYLENNYGS